jgi:hypothetical protein
MKTKLSRSIKLQAKLMLSKLKFARAYRTYTKTRVSPANSEHLLHYATWASSGEFPRLYSLKFPNSLNEKFLESTVDNFFSSLVPSVAASEIAEHGFYLIPDLLPESLIDSLLSHLENGITHPRGMEVDDFTPGKPNSKYPTWWMNTDEILKSSSVQALLCERNAVRTAHEYLKSRPQIMSLAMWKSFSGFGTDANASQKFHFDNDRANFIKLFVYLTDVTEDNGPHTYVEGSHMKKPKTLLHGEKLEDSEVLDFYKKSKLKVITGKKGQAFFADTAGFHKGTKVLKDSRAIFQINFATDDFGAFNKDRATAESLGQLAKSLNEIEPEFFESILK